MQYSKNSDGTITELPHKNVDTGMGVERITAVLEGVNDNYKASIWNNLITEIEKLSGVNYEGNEESIRIIADHIRSAVFIAADEAGIKPSNTDQGYILRRLIRRLIRHAKKFGIDLNSNFEEKLALIVINDYKKYYKELEKNANVVLEVLKNEKIKFNRTLEKGLKEFEKCIRNIDCKYLNKDLAFKLYDTYGFPIELTVEVADEHGMIVDVDGFYEKFKAHQDLSRAGSKEKFKGGLSGDGEMETKYHTATHLLNAALKVVVNKDVHPTAVVDPSAKLGQNVCIGANVVISPDAVIPVSVGIADGSRSDYLYEQLPLLIASITEAGYDIVPVSQVLHD